MESFKKALENFKNGIVSNIESEYSKETVEKRLSGVRPVYQSKKNALLVSSFCPRKGVKREVLALNLNGAFLGNSSRLSFTSQVGRDSVLEEQRIMTEIMTMVPFSVFKEADLDLASYIEIEKGPEETVLQNHTVSWENFVLEKDLEKVKNDSSLVFDSISEEIGNKGHFKIEGLKRKVHFMGARLFSVKKKGTEEKAVYLLDYDRNELEHGILNPFMVELSNKEVKTIKEAYESLKPAEVLEAEAKGLEVKRQGEWFFILSSVSPIDSTSRGFLRVGRNRPNEVERYSQKESLIFVSGVVRHTGREHKDLDLGSSWFLAVPNTSQGSFTITGYFD